MTGFAASGFGIAPSKSVLSCASDFASKYSIAGGLQSLGIGTSGVGGFITNALGGNSVSGFIDLARSFGSGSAGGHDVLYEMGQGLMAGPRQGIPGGSGPWGQSPSGLATGAIAAGVHSVISAGGELTTLEGTFSTVALTGADYAIGVGEIKFAADAGIYALGLAKCAAGH